MCLSGPVTGKCRVPVRLHFIACSSQRAEAALPGRVRVLPGPTGVRSRVLGQAGRQRAQKQCLLTGQKGQEQRAVVGWAVCGAPREQRNALSVRFPSRLGHPKSDWYPPSEPGQRRGTATEELPPFQKCPTCACICSKSWS